MKAATVLLSASLLAAGCAPSVVGSSTELTLVTADVRRATPSCEANPTFPVVGRVVGDVGTDPRRRVSYVGCFPSFASCEQWRRPVSAVVTHRMILNRCELR